MRRLSLGLMLVVLSMTACSGDPSPSPSTSAPGSVTPAHTGGSGAAGRVVVIAVYQPLCGGPEPVTPDPNCPPEPVADVQVTASDASGDIVAQATTGADGRAVLSLATGTFSLTAGPATPPRLPPRPTQVTVGTEPAPTVTLRYESSFQ